MYCARCAMRAVANLRDHIADVQIAEAGFFDERRVRCVHQSAFKLEASKRAGDIKLQRALHRAAGRTTLWQCVRERDCSSQLQASTEHAWRRALVRAPTRRLF